MEFIKEGAKKGEKRKGKKRKTAPKAPQKFFARAAGARAPISYIYLFFTIYNLYYNIKVGPMTFPGCHFRFLQVNTQKAPQTFVARAHLINY